ncbi:MAG: hypothetical protein AB9907_14820 [Flexilinea sp.]
MGRFTSWDSKGGVWFPLADAHEDEQISILAYRLAKAEDEIETLLAENRKLKIKTGRYKDRIRRLKNRIKKIYLNGYEMKVWE